MYKQSLTTFFQRQNEKSNSKKHEQSLSKIYNYYAKNKKESNTAFKLEMTIS